MAIVAGTEKYMYVHDELLALKYRIPKNSVPVQNSVPCTPSCILPALGAPQLEFRYK